MYISEIERERPSPTWVMDIDKVGVVVNMLCACVFVWQSFACQYHMRCGVRAENKWNVAAHNELKMDLRTNERANGNDHWVCVCVYILQELLIRELLIAKHASIHTHKHTMRLFTSLWLFGWCCVTEIAISWRYETKKWLKIVNNSVNNALANLCECECDFLLTLSFFSTIFIVDLLPFRKCTFSAMQSTMFGSSNHPVIQYIIYTQFAVQRWRVTPPFRVSTRFHFRARNHCTLTQSPRTCATCTNNFSELSLSQGGSLQQLGDYNRVKSARR